MPNHVTLKALQQQSADYASGIAGLEAKLIELEALKKRMQDDLLATAGARHAMDKLIAGLAEEPPASEPSAPAAPFAS